jgi:acyl-CoA reductase-like NAD-dependent aldehyde dehydrogenase
MGNEVPERDLYIGGKWVKPVKGKRFDVICPHDERKVGSIPLATAQDVDAAVAAAQAAKGAWGKSTGAFRAAFLRKIAEKVTETSVGRQSVVVCSPV